MEDDSSDEILLEYEQRETNKEPNWSKLYLSINPILFKTITGKPMAFHIKVDNKVLKKNYEELVIKFGGCINEDFYDAGGETAVMVDDSDKKEFIGKLFFKLSFINTCVLTNSLLSIDNYIHDRCLTKRRDFMKVFFWEEDSGSKTSVISKDSSDISFSESSLTINSNKISKKTRELYTRSEKDAILKFIIKKRKRLDGLRGDAIWREMERCGICPRRSYQSMKNHFLKTVLFQLDSFDFVSEEMKNKMLKSNN